jgi:hypothetical protein
MIRLPDGLGASPIWTLLEQEHWKGVQDAVALDHQEYAALSLSTTRFRQKKAGRRPAFQGE